MYTRSLEPDLSPEQSQILAYLGLTAICERTGDIYRVALQAGDEIKAMGVDSSLHRVIAVAIDGYLATYGAKPADDIDLSADIAAAERVAVPRPAAERVAVAHPTVGRRIASAIVVENLDDDLSGVHDLAPVLQFVRHSVPQLQRSMRRVDVRRRLVHLPQFLRRSE